MDKQLDQEEEEKEERAETNREGENLSRIELQHINNNTDNTVDVCTPDSPAWLG